MSSYNRSLLQWRCRRGSKELDYRMRHYLDHYFDKASRQEQEAFVYLLAMEDPELMGWISHLNNVHANPAVHHVLVKLRQPD